MDDIRALLFLRGFMGKFLLFIVFAIFSFPALAEDEAFCNDFLKNAQPMKSVMGRAYFEGDLLGNGDRKLLIFVVGESARRIGLSTLPLSDKESLSEKYADSLNDPSLPNFDTKGFVLDDFIYSDDDYTAEGDYHIDSVRGSGVFGSLPSTMIPYEYQGRTYIEYTDLENKPNKPNDKRLYRIVLAKNKDFLEYPPELYPKLVCQYTRK